MTPTYRQQRGFLASWQPFDTARLTIWQAWQEAKREFGIENPENEKETKASWSFTLSGVGGLSPCFVLAMGMRKCHIQLGACIHMARGMLWHRVHACDMLTYSDVSKAYNMPCLSLI